MLASKVYFNDGHLSKEAINREIDGTLKRLGTDYLDLYIIHRFDYTTPAEETMEALDALVKTGKVRALGASEMYAYQFHNLQAVADANGWTRFTSMQCHYNLLYREDERELIPVCQQYDVALTPYSPMASGHLARPAWDSNSTRGTTDGTMHNKYDQAKAQDMPIVERVHEVSERHGVPMAQVALAWHWAKGVTAPIVGCSKPARVDDAIAALNVQLTEDDIAYIEEPYTAHELVGPLSRPGEKALAGTLAPTLKETTRNENHMWCYLPYIWQIAPDSLANLPYIVELEADTLHPRSHFVGRYAGREPLTILPVASSRHIRQIRTAAPQRR